jgi:hypothetical protein
MREWVFIPRESERCSRAAPRDTVGPQRVGEGHQHSRRLFVADEFARQARRVQDVRQGRGRAAESRRRQTKLSCLSGGVVEVISAGSREWSIWVLRLDDSGLRKSGSRSRFSVEYDRNSLKLSCSPLPSIPTGMQGRDRRKGVQSRNRTPESRRKTYDTQRARNTRINREIA